MIIQNQSVFYVELGNTEETQNAFDLGQIAVFNFLENAVQNYKDCFTKEQPLQFGYGLYIIGEHTSILALVDDLKDNLRHFIAKMELIANKAEKIKDEDEQSDFLYDELRQKRYDNQLSDSCSWHDFTDFKKGIAELKTFYECLPE